MILTSHQPNFLPYMGVIYKAYKSDAIVLSDDVCYSKKRDAQLECHKSKER